MTAKDILNLLQDDVIRSRLSKAIGSNEIREIALGYAAQERCDLREVAAILLICSELAPEDSELFKVLLERGSTSSEIAVLALEILTSNALSFRATSQQWNSLRPRLLRSQLRELLFTSPNIFRDADLSVRLSVVRSCYLWGRRCHWSSVTLRLLDDCVMDFHVGRTAGNNAETARLHEPVVLFAVPKNIELLRCLDVLNLDAHPPLATLAPVYVNPRVGIVVAESGAATSMNATLQGIANRWLMARLPSEVLIAKPSS